MESHLPYADKGLNTEAEDAVFQENLSIRSRNNLSLIISDILIKQARTLPRDKAQRKSVLRGQDTLSLLHFLLFLVEVLIRKLIR